MSLSFAKDFHQTCKGISKGLFEGQVELELDDDSSDDLPVLHIFLTPKDGFYEGGRFEFKAQLGGFPDSPPNVEAVTMIYHPNIGCSGFEAECWDGSVCLNILNNDWDPNLGLEGLINGLLFLLVDPEGQNFSDALNSLVFPSSFAENVRCSVEGGYICTSTDDVPCRLLTQEDLLDSSNDYARFEGCLKDKEANREEEPQEIVVVSTLPTQEKRGRVMFCTTASK